MSDIWKYDLKIGKGFVVDAARRDAVAALRRRVATIEQGPVRAWQKSGQGVENLTLGVPGIDVRLPGGGLARGGLHEVLSGGLQDGYRAQGRGGAALAFTAVLAARRAALGQKNTGGLVLWCPAHASSYGPSTHSPNTHSTGLYGPGLAAFGLGAGQLILVHGRDDQQRLWAMEEGLKCTDLAMVVGEVGRLDLGQSRRLQLAAEASGVTALLLHMKGDAGPGMAGLGVSAALTRWRITPAPSAPTMGYVGIGATRCQVELLRCKGGRPGAWQLQWSGSRWDEQHEDNETSRRRDPKRDFERNSGRDSERAHPGQRETNPVPVVAPLAHGSAVSGPKEKAAGAARA